MEKFNLQWEITTQALATFYDSFEVIKIAQKTGVEKLVLAAEDSCIQRFEYTFDSFWKTVKSYLERKFNLVDINSPKSVFRASIKHTLCTEEIGEMLINMADDRNSTTHRYDIVQTREILNSLPAYCECMQTILNAIKI